MDEQERKMKALILALKNENELLNIVNQPTISLAHLVISTHSNISITKPSYQNEYWISITTRSKMGCFYTLKSIHWNVVPDKREIMLIINNNSFKSRPGSVTFGFSEFLKESFRLTQHPEEISYGIIILNENSIGEVYIVTTYITSLAFIRSYSPYNDIGQHYRQIPVSDKNLLKIIRRISDYCDTIGQSWEGIRNPSLVIPEFMNNLSE